VINTSESFADDVYTGAVSFAIKGTLLPRNTIETLAESRSLEELVNRLKATPYSDVVSRLQPPYSARRLELAFRERIDDLHLRLTKSSTNRALLESYYLREIAWNLKSALKSKALGKSYDQSIQYIDLHAEELIGRRDLIVKVISAKDIQEAATLLADSEFGKDVARATAAFLRDHEVRVFDLFIDHTLIQMIASALEGGNTEGAKPLVAIDIDSYNVLSILRAKLWKLSPTETNGLIVTPTFAVGLSTLQKIALTESVADAISILSTTRYAIQAPSSASDEELINKLEERFADLALQSAKHAFLWSAFQIGATLALIKLMGNEVRILAAIAFGVEAGVPSKNILPSLKL
jgi:V/A-type H+-transporting ATPase subunit C